MRIFFLLFLLIPLAEIYFLIQVGGAVGAGFTIVLVVLTAVVGAALVRAQGFSTFARVQTQIARGRVPAMEMLEGLLLFAAGALLLTPGFFTDAAGFIFLVPPLRRKIIRNLLTRALNKGKWKSTQPTGRIIDAEFTDPDKNQNERTE